MKVAIVGTGYVGLVAGTCFAETGNDVTCVDIDPAKVTKLQKGEPTIFEPGLKELMNKNQSKKLLHFTTNHSDAVKAFDVNFLTVSFFIYLFPPYSPLLSNNCIITASDWALLKIPACPPTPFIKAAAGSCTYPCTNCFRNAESYSVGMMRSLEIHSSGL